MEFPGSAVLVVDGGGFPGSTLDPGEAIVSRFLRSRKIGRVDFVAMTHSDADHAAGLAYLVNSGALLLAPAFAKLLFPAIMLPVFIGELAFALWLCTGRTRR